MFECILILCSKIKEAQRLAEEANNPTIDFDAVEENLHPENEFRKFLLT